MRRESGFEAAQRRGIDADRAYQQQAQAASGRIAAAAERIRTVPRLPGGAPVPVTVTAGDVSLANGILPAVASAPTGSWADPGAELRSLAGGPLTPGQVMAARRDDPRRRPGIAGR